MKTTFMVEKNKKNESNIFKTLPSTNSSTMNIFDSSF